MSDSSTSKDAGQQPPPAAGAPGPAALRPLPSTELFQGERSVEICHNGAIYRLQATRLGKLILTK